MAVAARAAGSKAAKIGTAAEVYSAAKSNTPRVRVREGGGAQRPVVTSLTVIVGAEFLHAWLVRKRPLPERSFLVRLAILGFVLSLMAELTPKLGKGMAYLVMTGVIFARSEDILKALQEPVKPAGATPPPGLHGEELTPVLYSRTGPMTAAPVLPIRTRAPRPTRGPQYLT